MGSADRTGGCQCGRLRYRITAEPRVLAACHCTECQRQSGSAFGLSLVVDRAHLQMESGTPKLFTRTGGSGKPVVCAFCGDCGTRITHAPEVLPDTINVKAGTLDDTAGLRPAFHVWLKSKQGWYEPPKDVKKRALSRISTRSSWNANNLKRGMNK